MTEARQLSDWDHTAALRCDMYNFASSFAGGKPQEDQNKFNPYRVMAARRIARKEQDTTVDGDFADATIDDVISAFVSEEE